MVWEIIKNPVVVSVALLLVLSVVRMNVAFAIVISAAIGGWCGGMNGTQIVEAFSKGLGNGAGIAFNYAMLGAFSIAISRSGVTELLASRLFKCVDKARTPKELFWFKYVLLLILTFASISSQNLIPVHIAFIPILIPPLLKVFEKIKLDRRAAACILTFGLITPYMVLPFGFGRIYLNEVLIGNIKNNGCNISADLAPHAMLIPALGMIAGLLIAVFISYRKPREYDVKKIEQLSFDNVGEIKPCRVIAGIIAIAVGLAGQLWMDSLVLAAVAGIAVFVISGVVSVRDTQDVFTKGVYMMGGIGIVMIGASGFAEVLKSSGCVKELVDMLASGIGDSKGVAVFLMLFVGLVITMGIGSSFSTVPLIAAIYVPLCMKLGMSPAAIIAVVGVAGALGDAGSPVSESVLGPTAGLNADGQHDHIYDSTIPTFIHYNIPLLIAGWIAGMVL